MRPRGNQLNKNVALGPQRQTGLQTLYQTKTGLESPPNRGSSVLPGPHIQQILLRTLL